MSAPVPVAFYAPLKSPDHASPSGDRTMARLLLRALAAAGFAPEIASGLRSLDLAGDPALQARLRREAEAEADRLIRRFGARPVAARPRLWFTYHLYYKAPDWIGPKVADALGVPYVVAEGSRAAKRASGAWALGHAGAEAALDRADLILVMTAADRAALERTRPARQRLVDLPPFIDLDAWSSPSPRLSRQVESRQRPGESPPADEALPATPPPPALSRPAEREGVRLLTVAMMRAGDKLASYTILADGLRRLDNLPWTLDIVGDGKARAEVERLFRPLGERVRFHGRIDDHARLGGMYEAADLFVWPAVNEAYGMVLLEAQAFGCPVVAGAFKGVASVVRPDETGRLAAPGDADALAEVIASLARDPGQRRRLGAAAAAFVRTERGLDQAAGRLGAALGALITVPAGAS